MGGSGNPADIIQAQVPSEYRYFLEQLIENMYNVKIKPYRYQYIGTKEKCTSLFIYFSGVSYYWME